MHNLQRVLEKSVYPESHDEQEGPSLQLLQFGIVEVHDTQEWLTEVNQKIRFDKSLT